MAFGYIVLEIYKIQRAYTYPSRVRYAEGELSVKTRGAENPDIVIIISENDYSNLTKSVQEFVENVESNLRIRLKLLIIHKLDKIDPKKIRKVLQDECKLSAQGCETLQGAVMVGNVPYALFRSRYDNSIPAPFMFYYQDLDAEFITESYGLYYAYASVGAHSGPEIFVSWIRPLEKTNFSYHQQLENYFAKHHAYFTGAIEPDPSIVFASHTPMEEKQTHARIFYPFYGKENLEYIAPVEIDQICPLKDDLKKSFSRYPEIAYLHSHASATNLYCINKKDILSFETQPLLMYTWGCSVGNFYTHESTSPALAFINGNKLGLTLVSKLHDNDIDRSLGFNTNALFYDFIRYWNSGDYAGLALLKTLQSYSSYQSLTDGELFDLYAQNGPLQMILIGSPFTFSNNAKNKLPKGNPEASCPVSCTCQSILEESDSHYEPTVYQCGDDWWNVCRCLK